MGSNFDEEKVQRWPGNIVGKTKVIEKNSIDRKCNDRTSKLQIDALIMNCEGKAGISLCKRCGQKVISYPGKTIFMI